MPKKIFSSRDEVIEFEKQESARAGKQKLFLLYGNDVVDVTDFAAIHPGGPDVLEDFKGVKDMKEAYTSIGHSAAADMQMMGFKIGTIDPAAAAKEQQQQGAAATGGTANNKPGADATSTAAPAPSSSSTDKKPADKSSAATAISATNVIIGVCAVAVLVGGLLRFKGIL